MTFVDYAVLTGYLLLMVVVGVIYRNKSHDNSDYIRLGGKGTWWLTGLSVFMTSFSVATFTGIAGQAYLAGWSAMSVTWCAALGLFVQAIFIAPWMRQTRAITPGDAIYMRFGRVVEQIFIYVGISGSLFWGGFMLLGLATFTSVLFGIRIEYFILVIGVVIIFYSVSGGSWSVSVTDSLQSFILLPVTVTVAVLCLCKVGGFSGLFEQIHAQNLASDFAFVKPGGYQYTGGSSGKIGAELFTLPWFAAMGLFSILGAANMTTCYRYLATKDGKEASKAAWLAGILLLLGSFIFYIPSIVGRVMYSTDIEALASTDIGNVADGAYAVVALKVLPRGMLGLVLIAMFSASMSSMDSFLTGTAGLITNNIYPPLARRLKWRVLQGSSLMRLTKVVNLLLGAWAIGMAILLMKLGGKEGIFKVMQTIIVLIGAPISTPFVLSFFVNRLPWWGPIVGMVCGWITAVIIWYTSTFHGVAIIWSEQAYLMAAVTIMPTMLTTRFWTSSTTSFRDRVSRFFTTIDTPIDFHAEVGEEDDASQLTIVGVLGMIMGTCLLPLVVVAQSVEGKFAAAFISLFVIGVSSMLFLFGRRRKSKADR